MVRLWIELFNRGGVDVLITKARLKEQLQAQLGYSTMVRWLHEPNYHLRVPQPRPNSRMKSSERSFWKNFAC